MGADPPSASPSSETSALCIVATLISVASVRLLGWLEFAPFPMAVSKYLRCQFQPLFQQGSTPCFAHAYSQWCLLRLLALPWYVLRRDVVKGAKKVGAGGRVPSSATRGTNRDFKGSILSSSSSFSQSGETKLTAMSVYLIYAR